jgi:Uma2 family endonuclease
MTRPASHHSADRLLTAAQFANLPREDAYRVELVRGRLVRAPRPMPLHARLVTGMVHRLHGFVEAAGTGVVLTDPGVLLAREPDTVRGPDVAFYSHARVPETRYDAGFWGAPDLAVEITSPSNRAPDVQEKVTDYLDAGVRLVWVVDPHTRTVTTHAPDATARILRSTDTLDGGDVLPGFRIPLAGFFAV